MRSSSTRDITLGALACALVAIFAFIPSVSFGFLTLTLQNMAVLLVGLMLPRRSALYGMLTFVFLVAIGVPLLSGGVGGFAKLIGPTSGYIWGWVIGAYLMAWLVERWGRTFWKCLATALLCGVLLGYACGIPVTAFVLHIPFGKTLIGSLIYVPGDVLKAVVASGIAVAMRGRLANLGQGRQAA